MGRKGDVKDNANKTGNIVIRVLKDRASSLKTKVQEGSRKTGVNLQQFAEAFKLRFSEYTSMYKEDSEIMKTAGKLWKWRIKDYLNMAQNDLKSFFHIDNKVEEQQPTDVHKISNKLKEVIQTEEIIEEKSDPL